MRRFRRRFLPRLLTLRTGAEEVWDGEEKTFDWAEEASGWAESYLECRHSEQGSASGY